MFTLPDLPYAYDALEPAISAEIMTLHHDRHHRTYVEKLNDALESHPELQGQPVDALLAGLHDIPESVRNVIRNNGGGHYNHSLFWGWMSPDGGGAPSGELADALNARYGSFDAFKEAFSTAAIGLFGSGWVWLQPDLSIHTTPDQDTLLSSGEPAALLGLDVWEHAYYLEYQNHRDAYVGAWWDVVNWRAVETAFTAANE